MAKIRLGGFEISLRPSTKNTNIHKMKFRDVVVDDDKDVEPISHALTTQQLETFSLALKAYVNNERHRK